jgi:hypothetical protein
MSNATAQRIVVEARSAYGVLSEGKWLNTNNKELLASFKVGKAYDISMDKVKSADGKVRTQIVEAKEVNLDGPVEAPIAQAKASAPKAVAPSFKAQASHSSGSGLSFAEKDARILVQGLTQAVIQSNLVNGIDNVEPVVVKLVDMVKRLSETK